uniref:MAX gene-associated protein n=1 Tax=Geotrypetes seraphini TaxID=260995 RepID=A0A6P8RQK1_GEOSA|nr:MAX gene-associated protein isoform X2 [Geotrypetes seraphini]
MDKQQPELEEQDGSNVPGGTPAFFVILKQPQENSTSEQGILVANHDLCAAPNGVPEEILVKPQTKTCLPADCSSGDITVTLDNNSMWNEFRCRNTEMILTKQGRRMFPYCRYWITGLNFYSKYILVMDISPVDNHRYKWNGRCWEPSGKAEPHVLGRVFIHPESPSTGQYWMHQPVSFYKLKLTNNILDQEGHIILHSMHRYLPRLHLVPVEKATEVIQLNGPGVHTFTFQQTEFFAVTAYQNIQITQLKIDYNPFAKGFRDDGLNNRPLRDVHSKNNSDQEEDSVSSSPSNRGFLENDWLDAQHRSQVSSLSLPDQLDTDIEKESFSAERDFLNFLDPNFPVENTARMKEEVSESPIASSFEGSCHAPSPLDSNGHFSVVIKEEPLDDYDYETSICVKGVTVKQEDSEEEVTDENSNSDIDYPILEKHLRRIPLHEPTKRPLTYPSGVAKAKMLKLDSEMLPVVHLEPLEPCTVTKSTEQTSEPCQTMPSDCMKENSPLSVSLDLIPSFDKETESFLNMSDETEREASKKTPLKSRGQQNHSSPKESQANNEVSQDTNTTKASGVIPRSPANEILSAKETSRRQKPLSVFPKSLISSIFPNTIQSVSSKKGRPRKLKINKTGRRSKRSLGKSVETYDNNYTRVNSSIPDIKPDLEDVDGVLFVSFASKEALDIHTTDKIMNEEPLNLQIHQVAAEETEELGRIIQFEKDLLEDLKFLRHRQVIHPSLQEVGLKLSFLDPTVSIDLKYLGVQLPLSYYMRHASWNTCSSPCASDAGFPFVSRTGKTNDFTKIKGWREKFNTSSVASGSRSEGNSLETYLKNRSAFCSDKLDEYLENEGKLMEACMGMSPSSSFSPVTYRLPTKSTSYVRTLDSVLKKQSIPAPSSSSNLKPLSVPSSQKKVKTSGKVAVSHSRTKASYRLILPTPITVKQKSVHQPMVEKATKTQSTTLQFSRLEKLEVAALDESSLPKQISVRQAQQYPQPGRPPGLSKSQLKLMDLEDCAMWDGKTRTYITEERADVSLTTLLTAQASLKNKPIHKIIRRRAPPCNNDFCRLGCVCASLSQEKRQPTHCRRPECMFGCSCLKRKVLLVKGGSKQKRILKKAVNYNLMSCGIIEEPSLLQEEKVEESGANAKSIGYTTLKKKQKLEYICDAEPEQPVGSYRIWEQAEGEVDPEPIYIPTSSAVEPVKQLSPYPEEPSFVKCKSVSGAKQGRVYSPKPNPVIRDEDKDPVYLYFESLMTCARVRIYKRKLEDQQQKQQISCEYISKHRMINGPEFQLKKGSKDTDRETGNNLFHSGADIFTSVHQEMPTKLIEIVSDCTWEEDSSKILSILPQDMNSSVPQSLKVGNLTIELTSEHKPCEELNSPIYSRVKISMPSYQDKSDNGEKSSSDIPSPCTASRRRVETVKFLRTDNADQMLEKLHGGKGLPFYTGLSPAGRLVAYKCKPNLNPSSLIQVNGKSYPQAKLLLGQMGALHPANRLAAYITGRLRPTVLDISSLSTVISKLSSYTKTASSITTSTLDFSTTTTMSNGKKHTLTNQKVPAQKPVGIAITASSEEVTTNPTTTMISPVAFTDSSKVTVLSTFTTLSTSTATISFPKTTVATSAIALPVSTIPSTVLITTTASSSLVTTTPSSVIGSSFGSIPVVMSGINTRNSLKKRPEEATSQTFVQVSSPQLLTPVTEKRQGQRLLLIPVQSNSTAVRPIQNVQLAQGQRMILQPLKNPAGGNLFKHPNGQIIQLVPLQPVRTPKAQPSTPQIVFHNPASVMGIRLPLPSKASNPSSSPIVPILSAVSGSSSTTTISVSGQNVGTIATTTPATPVSSAPSFLSHVGTLNLRISQPAGNSLPPSHSGSESKIITYSSGGQPTCTASLIHLQSGGFALLQLPGQKTVPSSILNHVATLHLKKDAQNLSQKGDVCHTVKQNKEKSSMSESEEVTDSKVMVSDSKQDEQDLSFNQLRNGDEISSIKEADEDYSSLEELTSENNLINETSTLEKNDSATVVSSDHSYTSDRKVLSKKLKAALNDLDSISEASDIVLPENIAQLGEPISSVHISDSENKSTTKLNSPGPQEIDMQPESLGSWEDDGKSKSQQIEVCATQPTGPMECLNNEQPETQDKKTDTCEKELVVCPNEKQADIIKLKSLEFRSDAVQPLSLGQEKKKYKTDQTKKSNNEECANGSHLREHPAGFKNEIDVADSLNSVLRNSRYTVSVKVATETRNSNSDDSKINKSAGCFFHSHDTENKVYEVPKQNKKTQQETVVIPTGDEDKTDDSADDLMEDFHSEEDVDIEKNTSGSSEDDEQVDIETVEELTEKINIARLKASATHLQSSKEQFKLYSTVTEKQPEKGPKRSAAWVKKYKSEEDAFAYYRQTHTANERRRRNEMRDLFERLKTALGLHNLPKVSKSYILKQAYEEIQGLTDQADKLIGQKNLLTRKQDMLIRKVSGLSGKTEEVVLKKLEYIYAKQKALEAEKKKKLLEDDESSYSFTPIGHLQNESYSPPEENRKLLMPNKRGRPLILSRNAHQVIEETTTSSVALTTASLVMTPQGQVLTLKRPLLPAQVTALPTAIQQVKLTSQNPSSTAARPDCEDLFMMPKIVNVTSLATEAGLNSDLSRKESASIIVDSNSKVSNKPPIRTTKDCENSAKIEGRNGQLAPSIASTQILFEDKELAFSEMLKITDMDDSAETGISEKIGIGEISESQNQTKETDGGTEQLKMKDSPFRKLKDSRIERELRKVASAMEEAALDPSDLMGSIEDHDDTDETLTSLLNEIAFLNQQLNNENSNLSVSPDFSRGDSELHRGISSESDAGDASFQFGNFKSFSDVRESSGSISPLLLHLEDDELHDPEKHLEQPSSQPSILKLVMGSEKDIALLSDGKKKTKDFLESDKLPSTPILQIKSSQETSSTDSLWRPMPKLAPLGLKAAQLPADQEGQSTKVMPSLAPVVLKLGSVGIKSAEKEEEGSRVMPLLSPVATTLNSSGMLPSSPSDK